MKRLTLIFALLVPILSHAADANKIDMTTVLKLDDGQPIKDPSRRTEDDKECAKCADLTIGHAIAIALNKPEPNLTVDQLYTRGALINRIRNNPDATISAEDATLIEHCLATVGFFPAVVVQIVSVIDPNFKPK